VEGCPAVKSAFPPLLEERVALVTGAASGVGLAVCRLFAEHGARLALLDVDVTGVRRAATQFQGMAVEADVRDEAQVQEAIERVARELGRVDILVNNAGIGELAQLEEYTSEKWNDLIDVNLSGAFRAIKFAAPLMRARGGGVIVNNASASGLRPTRGELPYSAAKAGLIALTQGAAQEYGPHVRVNAVSPGLIRTPMSETLFADAALLEPVKRATPLGRYGTDDDVACVILFLASDLSRFMTGQNLIVDGGLGLAQAGIDDVLRSLLSQRSTRKRG
jgi:NAD(P)-dependent dehydrogenase (short-subunit alcohol dehydrogenase family)